MQEAAFFDLDKTVIAKSSTLAFGKPLYKAGFLGKKALARMGLAQAFYMLFGADEEQLERARDELLHLTAGWKRDEFEQLVRETLADVAEPLGAELEQRATATSRSAVSRRFVRATRHALDELMARDLSELDATVLMLDGIMVAGQCCVAALLITSDGRKVPVGLWLGDTENKTVVTGLLADLSARGFSAEGGLLVVIDGAKALAAGVRRVFGEAALIQRCTLHKRRDVAGYLGKETAGRIDRRLGHAFGHPDPTVGLARAKAIAVELGRDHPDAAASLREGLDEMFTVRRLGIEGRLARTLTTTNPIESMISIARTTMGHVKRWRDGTMKKRWMAAGMLEAERSFRRVKGCREMPVLVAALRRHAAGLPPTTYHEEAA